MKEFFKKNKKILLISIAVVIVIAIGLAVYFIFSNEYALTVEERNWIDENITTINSINVVNNANIFGHEGEGVFYDFLESFEEEYGLTMNPVTTNYDSPLTTLSLSIKKELAENDVVFYKDHYALIGTSKQNLNSYKDIEGLTIGILSSDKQLISSKLTNVTYMEFATKEELLAALNVTVTYIIVPTNLYLEDIIRNNYEVVMHLNDINYYYVLNNDGSILGDILSKFYYDKWNINLYESIKDNEFAVYVNSLNISESEIADLTSVVYDYGFIENSPYEVLKAGEFGGISAVLLKEFSDFTNVEFNFNKYNNYDDFKKGVTDKEIDVYLNKYNLNNDYLMTTDGFDINYSIVANIENDIVINTINGLINQTVYVEANTKLFDLVNNINGVTVKTYENEDELFDLNKKNEIIILDTNAFNYYSSSKLNNYTSRYNDQITTEIEYKVNNNVILNNILNAYLKVTSEEVIINKGINNHIETVKSGNLISTIARYIILLVILGVLIVIYAIRKTRKIQIAVKIKKDDKLKFIDQLTSLKNRNYLNECLDAWNKNTIYPQTIIVIDLNAIQKLNDQYGYNEGDRQIKSFANILIKTQLDNSEVMRTDGNEFVIYLIGYNQKQVTNYIHKLNKETSKLPYDNGVKFGYSMILDNLKSIEDCLNEASIDMKSKKKDE